MKRIHKTMMLTPEDHSIYANGWGFHEIHGILIADARDAALSAERFGRAQAWKTTVADIVRREIRNAIIYQVEPLP